MSQNIIKLSGEREFEVVSSDYEMAEQVHAKFQKSAGSDHICNLFALSGLIGLVRHIKPKLVVEYGAGIGTITYAVLSQLPRDGRLVSVEMNEFCLGELDKNIPDNYKKKLDIISDYKSLKKFADQCDLMIIDGSFNEEIQASPLKEGSVCFFEGIRERQRNHLRMFLEQKNLTCDLYEKRGAMKPLMIKKTNDRITGAPKTKISLFKRPKGFYAGAVRTA